MGVKRGVDIVVGTVLAVVALPLILVLAVGAAVTLRAWPIFVQDRIGKDGRTFRLPKVRTLPPDTASSTDKYSLSKVRIPAFGRVLRRTHLDELPQLLLVPFGLMSLVGPRPEMPEVLADLQTREARDRRAEGFVVARAADDQAALAVRKVQCQSCQQLFVVRGFGVFNVKPRKTGIGRNPRTGAEVSIPPGKAVRFKPGKELQTLQ